MMLRGGAMVLILSFMWPFGQKDWRDAEKVWRAGMEAEGNPQKNLRRHDWMPYAFLTRTGTTNIWRVVHKGRLLPVGGGVEALASYLRDIDAFHREKLVVADVTELLEPFKASPPSAKEFTEFQAALKPQLTRTPDKIELVVHCILPDPNTFGNPDLPDDKDVEKWTLTIERQHAAWRKEMIKVKRSTMAPH